jgi:zinc finger SWIM domain-containing protein 3
MRMQNTFWMSPQGLGAYIGFPDVIEVDATYKTNRFNIPLVLCTGVNNHGNTSLICGALLSDETFKSYEWFFTKLQKACPGVTPGVIFSDGDPQIAKAIRAVFPSSTHLLCRFHIAQNILKHARAWGVKGDGKTKLLQEFWRAASLESVADFEREYQEMCESMPDYEKAQGYLQGLLETKKKWAFCYTHSHFVAGVASTQRQESANYQVSINHTNVFREILVRFTLPM